MTTHTITLDKIDFKDNSGRFNLQYPLYPSHIDYGKLANRDLVQIEPAPVPRSADGLIRQRQLPLHPYESSRS
jgi:hypothetical protein